MKTIKNVIFLKDSTMLNGYVRVESFTLESDYGSIVFKKSQLSTIEYRSTSANGKDKITTSEGSTLIGNLLPVLIPIEIDGATINIPKSDISYMVLFVGRGGRISSQSKGMLKRIGVEAI